MTRSIDAVTSLAAVFGKAQRMRKASVSPAGTFAHERHALLVVSLPEAYPATGSLRGQIHDGKVRRILPDRFHRGIPEDGDELGLLGQLPGPVLARLPVVLAMSGLALAPAVLDALACRARLEGVGLLPAGGTGGHGGARQSLKQGRQRNTATSNLFAAENEREIRDQLCLVPNIV